MAPQVTQSQVPGSRTRASLERHDSARHRPLTSICPPTGEILREHGHCSCEVHPGEGARLLPGPLRPGAPGPFSVAVPVSTVFEFYFQPGAWAARSSAEHPPPPLWRSEAGPGGSSAWFLPVGVTAMRDSGACLWAGMDCVPVGMFQVGEGDDFNFRGSLGLELR